jgi:succinoglycan biosynthesis transport protein ExoP
MPSMAIELRDYIGIARKWLWLFLLATSVAAVGAWVGTRFMARTYASSTTVMVGRAMDNPDVNAQTVYLSQQLATTYSQMAAREPVLKAVIDELGLKADWRQLESMVKSAPQPGTPLFEIRVVATNPDLAQAIAAETATQLIAQSPTERQRRLMQDDAFIMQQLEKLRGNLDTVEAEIETLQTQIDLETSARGISEIENRLSAKLAQRDRWQERYAELRSASEGGEVNALAVIEPATTGIQVGPNVRMNVLLAALLGFGLALGAVLLMEYLDDTIKTPEEVERRFGLAGLASVDRFDAVENRFDGLITLHQPRSPIAESYRTLRTNLQFALLQRPGGVLVVTSANPGEGKSTTAANLAVVMAQSGKRVVLVDGDLRKPSLHRFFQLTNNLGMTSLLLDPKLKPTDALREVEELPSLRVLTSGPLPPNPAEVLGSEGMKRLIAALRTDADLVIVDSPPILLVTDAAIVSAGAAGTLLVMDSGTTRTDAARKAIETLAKAGVTPLGVVVNKLDRARAGGYYRYSYYSYRGGYADFYGSDGSGDGASGDGASGDTPGDGAQSGGAGDARAGRGGRAGHSKAARPRGGWRQRLGDTLTSLLG